MRSALLTVAVGLLLSGAALATDGSLPACCDRSAARGETCCVRDCEPRCCTKGCQVVCEMKQVKRTVWVVECEEFCAPLPNCDRRGRGCCNTCRSGCCGGSDGCDRCCCEDPCQSLQDRRRVPPRCGPVRTRKKLVKKEITCEVPVYRCVIGCSNNGCGEVGAGCMEPEPLEEDAVAPSPVDKATDVAPLPSLLGAPYSNLRRMAR